MDRITVDGKRFIDNYGRHRIFNGVNFCDKNGYYININEYTEMTVRRFKESGFNVIRMGVTWSTLEPKPGEYNDEYIDKMIKFADLCAENGIYVFLDMHQDCWGGSNHNDGAPDWACLTRGKKLKKYKFVWAEDYFWGKATQNCFDSFWANDEVNGIGLQEYFCNMWVHLVSRFKGHPALWGFDLFNEPHNGREGFKVFKKLIASVAKTVLTDKRCNKPWMIKQLLSGKAANVLEPFSDPDLLRKVTNAGNELIAKFDKERYSPFINKLSKAIRSVTDEGIILYEGTYFTNIGIPYSAPAVNYDGIREKNQCFSPHGYDITVDTPAYENPSDSRVWAIFEQKMRDQERLDVPVLVGEWGSLGSGEKWVKHLEFLLSKFDENKWSQAYFTFFYEFFMFDYYKYILDCIVRPVPVAVCGDIDFYRHNREDNSFTLEFTQEREYDAPTVIYAHKEIESIEVDGEYEIIPIDNCTASNIEIKTGAGHHRVRVKFK